MEVCHLEGTGEWGRGMHQGGPGNFGGVEGLLVAIGNRPSVFVQALMQKTSPKP